MFKFTFIYSDNSVKQKVFASAEAGIAWAHNEGDHLVNYKYTHENAVESDLYKFWLEYHNGNRVYKDFPTLKEGYDYVYGIGDAHIRNYGFRKVS
jgi:hypothetical protein